jgi:hypothetical protein
MIDEKAIKAEIRLYVLESAVCQLWATLYEMTGDPAAAFEQKRAALIETARQLAFPSLDPAMSDLAAAEIEEAAERLLKMQQELVERALQRRSRREPPT